MNKTLVKQKMSIAEILTRFFFGFLIPYLLINGILFFIFIQTPTIKIVGKDDAGYEENKIKFTVDCLLPIVDIKTYHDDAEISYSKLGDTYVIEVTENGVYKVNVTALNKSRANYSGSIENKDSTPPTVDLDNTIITGNTLIVSIHDDQSGINYDNVYATYDNGDTVKPNYIDKVLGTVQFQIESGKKLTLHIEDDLGNATETSFNVD